MTKSSADIFMVSSLTGDGLDRLKEELVEKGRTAGVSGWEFEGGITSDLSGVDRVREIVREKLFRIFHKEIPYSVSPVNTGWATDPKTNKLHISFDLFVPTKSQKVIVEKRAWLIEEKAGRDSEKLLGIEEGGVVFSVKVKVGKTRMEL